MTNRPDISDESVLVRWINLEISRMNQGLVIERKPLATLLLSANPSSVTRNGEAYNFNREVIMILGNALPKELHRKLKLPIQFTLSTEVPDSCSCPDPFALTALQLLGEVSTLRIMQGACFWVSRPLVYDISKKYPTAAQVVMGA